MFPLLILTNIEDLFGAQVLVQILWEMLKKDKVCFVKNLSSLLIETFLCRTESFQNETRRLVSLDSLPFNLTTLINILIF